MCIIRITDVRREEKCVATRRELRVGETRRVGGLVRLWRLVVGVLSALRLVRTLVCGGWRGGRAWVCGCYAARAACCDFLVCLFALSVCCCPLVACRCLPAVVRVLSILPSTLLIAAMMPVRVFTPEEATEKLDSALSTVPEEKGISGDVRVVMATFEICSCLG